MMYLLCNRERAQSCTIASPVSETPPRDGLDIRCHVYNNASFQRTRRCVLLMFSWLLLMMDSRWLVRGVWSLPSSMAAVPLKERAAARNSPVVPDLTRLIGNGLCDGRIVSDDLKAKPADLKRTPNKYRVFLQHSPQRHAHRNTSM